MVADYIIGSVEKIKLSCYNPRQRSTTIPSEVTPFLLAREQNISFLGSFDLVLDSIPIF